ncbi:MAG: endonuclease [Methylobacter sp.]|nr:MAG: endonuclease [Methylobacter sp.]PPD04199.1 MAG: endonuclease [Methylobacter sp.]PPD21185.1 MAG: endonuclease [Methylobacter sp.]
MPDWQVYIILGSDNSLYTGISTNAAERFIAHATKRGAKYFWGRKPRQIVYLEAGHNRSSASRREAAIKKMPRAAKLALIASECNKMSGFISVNQA